MKDTRGLRSTVTPPDVSWLTELAPGDPDIVFVRAVDSSTGEVLVDGQLVTASARGLAAVTHLMALTAHPSDASLGTRSRPSTHAERRRAKSYAAWDATEDVELRHEFSEGRTVGELADIHERTVGAIVSRLSKIGLL